MAVQTILLLHLGYFVLDRSAIEILNPLCF